MTTGSETKKLKILMNVHRKLQVSNPAVTSLVF